MAARKCKSGLMNNDCVLGFFPVSPSEALLRNAGVSMRMLAASIAILLAGAFTEPATADPISTSGAPSTI